MTTESNSKTAENVDEKEIEKFQSLANRWWDAEGDMKSLHDINPLRANYIDKLASASDKTILDVGCGAGILSEGLAQRGGIVTGIDMGDELINVAKLHLHESKLDIEYQVTSTEQLAKKAPGTFDVVCCMEMLEHVPDPASVVKACADLTAPGGHLFFSTINRNPKAWLFAIVGGEYILKLLPKGTHQYEKLIKPSELASFVRAAGCQVDEMTGLEYNPLTNNYFLSKNTSVNYMMHVRKPA